VDLPYKGLILEVSFRELARYRSPEAILSRPGLTHCFAVDSILSDPTGMLRALREAVAREYTRREWVLARCEYEKRSFADELDMMYQADAPAEVAWYLLWALVYVAGIIAVAHLRQPTHRRCLALMRELLESQGRSDLCEEALAVMGCAHMSRRQVEGYLRDTMSAFDRAVEVHRTPSPIDFKLHPHVRPYIEEGARELIREGYHREAIPCICVYHWVASKALQQDAPEEEKPLFQVEFDRLLAAMGLATREDWAARAEQARALAEEVFQVAGEIVAQNPEIVD
jgi:hypothetical protein